jgi:hypothetical protein
MSRRRAFAILHVTFLAALAGAASSGCATEQKMLRTPRYTLSYPDYWKVDSVAQKDGEATHVTIGKYSETIVNAGEGATGSSANYEASQADVDVRIFAWPIPAEGVDPSQAAAQLMFKDPDLEMQKQGRLPPERQECGRDFKRKFTLLGEQHETFDLASRPGHRLIVVGGQSQGTLLGVAARVPYEQDMGLYCHNLSNMMTQLQTLLDGIKLVSGPPAPGAPPATSGPPPATSGAAPAPGAAPATPGAPPGS